MATAGNSRRSLRVSKPVDRMILNSTTTLYNSKYLLFFIRKTKTYHNFTRSSVVLSHNNPNTEFIFGQDYPLVLQDGIYNGMFIVAESWSKMTVLEKELDRFITDNKENSSLSDSVKSHMRVFMREQSNDSSSENGNADCDDSDEDITWQPSHNSSHQQQHVTGTSVSPSVNLYSKTTPARANSSSCLSLSKKNLPSGPSQQVRQESSNLVTRRLHDSNASLSSIATEEQRALPPELLPRVHDSTERTCTIDHEESRFLTCGEFRQGMDSLKRFISHKLKKHRPVSNIHHPTSAEFVNEEFVGHDGRVYVLADFPRGTTSKFIRAYACAKYGMEYMQSHVFGELSGPSHRPIASKEVQDDLKGQLMKVFRIPRDQVAAAWISVKDSLNRLGPESTFRKRKASAENDHP